MNANLIARTSAEPFSPSMGSDGSSPSIGAALSPSQRTAAGVMLEVLGVARDGLNDPELPIQLLLALLQVAHRVTPPAVTELGAMAGMHKSSASRWVQILGRGINGARAREGLGLVETYEDPENWSRKLVRLTPKGYQLIEQMGHKLFAGIQRMNKEK